MRTSVLTALSNTVRLQLITCLGKRKMNVSGLIKNCGLSQSAVSQHLMKLRQAGLVDSEKQGKKVYYGLIDAKTAQIAEELQKYIRAQQDS